jgi:hypothetical protein
MNRLFLLIFLATPLHAGAQGILGGDLDVIAQFSPAFAHAYVVIYKEGNGNPEGRIIDWGDGTLDTLSGILASTPFEGVVTEIYHGFHYYPLVEKTYTVTVRDSFLVEGIKNIDNSGNEEFIITNTIKISPSSMAIPMQYMGLALDLEYTGDGAVTHHANGGFVAATAFDSVRTYLLPFTEEGYTFPEATDTITCCPPFVWDGPVEPGRYAFAIGAETWYNGEVVGEDVRKMVIEVDSSFFLTSTNFISGLNASFQLFPNPVSSTLHLQLPQLHTTEGKLIIENLSGQMLYTEDLNLSPAPRSWQLDVGGWPRGVYVVRLQVGAEQMVRKFVKE